jgi:hypothetical protein
MVLRGQAGYGGGYRGNKNAVQSCVMSECSNLRYNHVVCMFLYTVCILFVYCLFLVCKCHCCCTVVTLLSHCCQTVGTLLSRLEGPGQVEGRVVVEEIGGVQRELRPYRILAQCKYSVYTVLAQC